MRGNSNRRYCSRKCQTRSIRGWKLSLPVVDLHSKAKRPRYRRLSLPVFRLTDCQICGNRLLTNKNQQVCSENCKRERRRRELYVVFLAKRKLPSRSFDCLECGKQATSTWCNAKFCTERCSRIAHMRARRARKRRAFVEHVYLYQLMQRDNNTCQICNKPVDTNAMVPSPYAPTVDHIVALANGGQHGYANCQLAHFLCNSRKGAW